MIFLGEEEFKKKAVTLKCMDSGNQETIIIDDWYRNNFDSQSLGALKIKLANLGIHALQS